ncbi:MAG: S41 family peptidase [Anaerolineales bacterium]|nr:S41 family peptidase [Anaerolineales bacterium]
MEDRESLKHFIIRTLLFILNIVAAFALGWLIHGYLNPPELDFPVLSEAYNILIEHGLKDPPPDPAIEYGMAHGMVSAYGDPYTRFVEPPQHEIESNNLAGSYGGIGASLRLDEENYVTLYPFPDSPAAEAGVQDGDRLVGVDDVTLTPENPIDEVLSMVRGPEGEKVKITVARPPDYENFEFSIKRANIPLPSVTWYLAPDEARLGVIQINLIAATTPEEIENAVAELDQQGAEKFALDLRNNGGGLLDEGVEIARLFLSNGIVIQEQSRGERLENYPVNRPGALADLPMIVLVNEYTASAAEIIAGSIQAHHRAQLVGTTTFGKDTVQLVFDLQDGSSMHITSANWWIPGLEFPTENGGLIPDIPLTEDIAGADPALTLAIDCLFNDQAQLP